MKLLRRTWHLLSIVTLFLLCTSALAQSQRPSGERRQPIDNTNAAGQQATSDPRGTNAAPLFIQVRPTQKTDAETAEEQRQKSEQASDRRWTRGLAIITAVVGFLQLVAIAFQVRIATQQNAIIGKQSEIMTGQREAADAQSGYMRDGLAETKKAADAAVESAQTQRNQMYLTLRARMGLQRVTVPKFAADTQMLFSFILQNYGGKGAMIEEAAIDFTIAAMPLKKEHHYFTVGVPVEAGSTLPLFISYGPIQPAVWEQINSETGAIHLKAIDEIRYQVGFGSKVKRLGFCLQFDPAATRLTSEVTFTPVGGKEYNYAD